MTGKGFREVISKENIFYNTQQGSVDAYELPDGRITFVPIPVSSAAGNIVHGIPCKERCRSVAVHKATASNINIYSCDLTPIPMKEKRIVHKAERQHVNVFDSTKNCGEEQHPPKLKPLHLIWNEEQGPRKTGCNKISRRKPYEALRRWQRATAIDSIRKKYLQKVIKYPQQKCIPIPPPRPPPVNKSKVRPQIPSPPSKLTTSVGKEGRLNPHVRSRIAVLWNKYLREV